MSALSGDGERHFWQGLADDLPGRCWMQLEARVAGSSGREPVPHELRGAIGGAGFCLRVADAAMAARLFPALAHLRTDGEAAAGMTVVVGHPAQGRRCIQPPEGWRHSAWRKALAFCSDDRRRFYYEEWLNTLIGVDVAEARALAWYPHPDELPLYEMTAPLRAAFHPWLACHGMQIVHAAAVAPPGKAALLLAGPGGSGKSTSALAALEAGWDYLGDDLCVIRDGRPPEVLSLYQFAKLREASLPWFPGIAAGMTRYEECGELKAVCAVGERFPERLRLSAPIGAIVLPEIGPAGMQETTADKARWTEVMRAVLPWTLKQLPGSGREVLETVFRVLPRVPAYRLRLGRDRAAMLRCLESLT